MARRAGGRARLQAADAEGQIVKQVTISVLLPTATKDEARAVLAAHGLSVSEFIRIIMQRISEGDPTIVQWLKDAPEEARVLR